MKKNSFIVSVCFLLNSVCLGQKSQPFISDILKVNFLSPGLSYEKSISSTSKQSVFLSAFLSPVVQIGISSSIGNSSSLRFEPTAAVQYRYYYNFNKRAAAKKEVSNNNLNYFAPIYKLSFSKRTFFDNYVLETKNKPIHKIGAVWGFQRNYKKHFSIDINAGAGYLASTGKEIDFLGNISTKKVNRVVLLAQITLGFWSK
jgi:hypothetical protein